MRQGVVHLLMASSCSSCRCALATMAKRMPALSPRTISLEAQAFGSFPKVADALAASAPHGAARLTDGLRPGLGVSKSPAQGGKGAQGGAVGRSMAVRGKDVAQVLRVMTGQGIFSSHGGSVGEAGALRDLSDLETSAVVFDLDALRAGLAAVKEAFPPHWLHCFAIKACPLSAIVREFLDAGLGMETASIGEAYLALAHGCPPAAVVFDSPAKTQAELELALARGILVNANCLDELDRIHAIIEAGAGATGEEGKGADCVASASTNGNGDGGEGEGGGGGGGRGERGRFSAARVGIRINPLVGAGSIAELSVSTRGSKFGVPATAGNRRRVLDAFGRWPWLVGLHVHVGSQGCSLEQLAEGVAVAWELADAVDTRHGPGRVSVLDIGGGLPANYSSEEATPSFAEYAAVLQRRVPGLFRCGGGDNGNGRPGRTVVTEFGRALVTKAAFVATRVEYVRRWQPERPGKEGHADEEEEEEQEERHGDRRQGQLGQQPEGESLGPQMVPGGTTSGTVEPGPGRGGGGLTAAAATAAAAAALGVGADPGAQDAAAGDGEARHGAAAVAAEAAEHQTLITHAGSDLFLRECYCPGKFPHRLSVHGGGDGAPLPGPAVPTDVAGPLCFGGDFLARGARLPAARPGDLVVVHDAGANSLSMFSRHCSRPAPAVYGYTAVAAAAGEGEEEGGGGGDGEGGREATVHVRLLKPKETLEDVVRFWGAPV